RRPAPVRGLRRADRHRSWRSDARRARRGLDDRQLLARRRLEGHVGARGRRRRRSWQHERVSGLRPPAARAAGPPLRWLARPAATAAAGLAAPGDAVLMLARIAHELYW